MSTLDKKTNTPKRPSVSSRRPIIEGNNNVKDDPGADGSSGGRGKRLKSSNDGRIRAKLGQKRSGKAKKSGLEWDWELSMVERYQEDRGTTDEKIEKSQIRHKGKNPACRSRGSAETKKELRTR